MPIVDDDGNEVVNDTEIEVVYNAMIQAIALEQTRRPNDDVTAVGAHLIAAFTPFRGRSKVHAALNAMRAEGRIKVSRKGKNPNVNEFSPAEAQ